MWNNKTRQVITAAIAVMVGISLSGCATEPGRGERLEDLEQVQDTGVAGAEEQAEREQNPDPAQARAEEAMGHALKVMRDGDKLDHKQVGELYNIVIPKTIGPEKGVIHVNRGGGYYSRAMVNSRNATRCNGCHGLNSPASGNTPGFNTGFRLVREETAVDCTGK